MTAHRGGLSGPALVRRVGRGTAQRQGRDRDGKWVDVAGRRHAGRHGSWVREVPAESEARRRRRATSDDLAEAMSRWSADDSAPDGRELTDDEWLAHLKGEEPRSRVHCGLAGGLDAVVGAGSTERRAGARRGRRPLHSRRRLLVHSGRWVRRAARILSRRSTSGRRTRHDSRQRADPSSRR